MTFEQEIATIDELARSCRSREQANVMLETEVQALRADNIRLNTALEHRQEHLDALDEKTLKTTAKLEDEIRNNGELKATLKQLLAEQMALASRAAEMLRELEDKPTPVLQPPGPITNANGKVEAVDEQPKTTRSNPFKEAPPFLKEKLAPFMKRDEDDLKIVPIGHYFTLDPPKVEDVTERGVKWWYRLSAGGCPQFYLRDRPGVEFKMEAGGPVFVRFVSSATNKEEREPLPFRPENAKPEGSEGSTQAFGDDGGSIPNFLKQGPSYADQRREADHL
jgi:hypothetical protein